MKLKEIAKLLSAEVRGDKSLEITGIARIETAKEGELSYISSSKYTKWLNRTNASCIIISREIKTDTKKTLLLVDEPEFAFAKLAEILYKKPTAIPTISPLAYIPKNAVVDKTATIGEFCILSNGSKIGRKTVLHPQVYIGENAAIGNNCIIYPGVVIREKTEIKNRVIIHPGCVIGADGFGYIEKKGKRIKIPHIGGVVIEDDVEIGANTTIDRATLGNTTIGKGTKIDNLVHIAHNVSIGENSIVVAQVGIAGSTEVGNNVIIAGQVGISDHLKIGDSVRIGAKSGVGKSVKDGEEVSGYPAREHKRSRKVYSLLMRLPELYQRIKKLEKMFEAKKKR